MNVYRYKENPLITPADVTPHRDDFEVIGAFNAGITEYNGEILMLLRVAERPIHNEPNVVKAPVYNHKTNKVDIIELETNNPEYLFDDPRTIRKASDPNCYAYLTSLSYLRIARSKDGHEFTVDDGPFIYPGDPLEAYGVEDPRITKIGDVYYIYYSAASPYGVGETLVSTKDFNSIERHG